MASNILSVFNPPPQRELTDEETKDCIPCQIMSTMFSLGFGGYLALGKPFEYSDKEKKRGISLEKFQELNPRWWRASLRGLGGALMVFGVVRGTEKWLWNSNTGKK
ncbi:Dmo2p LALA0_S05e08526g [Lachancea lanzarotensis]|uniref:LALA0S05e08526g1_1 n=1 Tax=Lachancea lanzarotensis TaxID=1245769 RepID=A0A0C7MRP6_9SACH|nr:uncharacterized protein LALA0_S05e08526g [Lachancea lanzarotensis]CEP62568.1 LALA0S05e08526g1_1 [Lachancea lanzarotensis]